MSEEASGRKVVIAGGTGFLGLSLAHHLEALGYSVVLLSRTAPPSTVSFPHATWDGRSVGAWADTLEGATAVVNLAGRTVDCVKTPDHCDEILRSRVEATAVLGKALRERGETPPVWVQMSTAHIYGDPPEAVCDEGSAFGFGLAPTVGRAWEEEFARAVPSETRSVVLRTSFVLGRSAGALPRLATLARFGLGGKVGHGRQGFSWIHERDMNRLFQRAIEDAEMRGAYIATAPEPVGNAEFMHELRRAVGMPFGLPTAAWQVRLAAPLVMKTDPELALYGRFCVSKRLQEEGFAFEFPSLPGALADLFSRAS
ncbi:MAG: TIGR01777 family oxidoreductase [Myxococcota bacterium]